MPALPQPIAGHFTYNFLLSGFVFVFGKFTYGYTYFVVVNQFLQAMYLVAITGKHKLFTRLTFVPAYMFLVFASIFPAFNSFGETMFLNWFLLGAIDIMFSFSQTNQPSKMIFNAGFFVCMAVLFQFTFLTFFLLMLVSLVVFRPFDLGEWAVAFMGLFTPVYFFIGILYLTDKLPLLHNWFHLGFSVAPFIGPHYVAYVTMFGILFLLLLGLFALQRNVATSNIYNKRNWIAISFYFIIAILVGFITDDSVHSAWLVVVPPISIICAHALLLDKKKLFSNFSFYFSLLLIIFCLWANK